MKRNRHIRFFKSGIILPLLIAFVALGFKVSAQSNASIENIDFYAEGMKLVITYDIVQAKSNETFEIWAKVITASGREIVPKSTTGDVGTGVSGGPNKRITWDVEADNVTIDEEFSVDIFARSNLKEKETKTQVSKDVYTEIKKENKRGISPGGAMLLSAILPGLGKTVVHKGGAQWLWGIVGYGCVIGSISLNGKAYDTYQLYLESTDPTERDNYFTDAEQYDITSKVLAGSAALIWIIDIITTGSQASKARRRSQYSKVSLNYKVDPLTGKPLLGLNYRF